MKKLTAMLLVLLLLVGLTACGASSKAENSVHYSDAMAPQAEAPMEMAPEMEMDMAYGETAPAGNSLSAESGSTAQVPSQRKWIITMDMTAETENLDELLTALNAEIASLGGYVEGQNIYNGSA